MANIIRVQLDDLDDKGSFQMATAKGRAGETLGGGDVKLIRAQEYGSSSHPPKGSMGYALQVGNSPSHFFLLGIDNKDTRPRDIGEGGKAIYGPDGQILKYLKGKTEASNGGKPFISKDHSTYIVEADESIILKVGGMTVEILPGRINLGEGASQAVMTQGGASSKVFAVT